DFIQKPCFQRCVSCAVLKLFPGIGQPVVRSVCNTPGLKALILETYGAGNAPLEAWFLNEIQQAIEKGLYVINVTQCIGGSVQPGQYETSRKLMEMQVANGKDITTESALAKAMYLLGKNRSALEFKAVFERSLRGEMV
ncbi:MAG: L-asparaginase 1, partial [Bacteroidota bacterium]